MLILKIALAYYELGHKFDFKWLKEKQENSFFNLSMLNQRKLILLSNVLYWFIFLVDKIYIFIIWPVYFLFLIVVAYIFSYYQYNFLILITYAFLFLYAYSIICNFSAFLPIVFLMVVNFLKWKQDEILKSLHYNLLMRNYKKSI